MSILATLSYPWQETISFLNINQKWSQATGFTSRSKFGAVPIWPDILGLGPGRVLLVKQFDISSSGKLPSLGAQPLPGAGPPPGSGPLLPKALLLLRAVEKPLPVVAAANSIASMMLLWHFGPCEGPRRIGLSAALCCSQRKKNQTNKWQ